MAQDYAAQYEYLLCKLMHKVSQTGFNRRYPRGDKKLRVPNKETLTGNWLASPPAYAVFAEATTILHEILLLIGTSSRVAGVKYLG